MKRKIITIVTLFSILLVLWGGTGISSNASGFVDVPSGAFYYDAVNWAVANSITQGTDSTHFKPNSPCIRSQIVTFIWKAYGSPEPYTEVNPFVDIQDTDYYYKAVLWAVKNGITSGMDATHFKPNKPCTRAQVVTFLWNAAGKPEPLSSYNSFSDVSINAMYFKAVRWAGEQDITYGTNATHFSPSNTCSRGQIVTFIYRAVSDQIHHHDWVLSQESAPTCTQKGTRNYYCTTCGETKAEAIPEGHKWTTKTEKVEVAPGYWDEQPVYGYRCHTCGFFTTSGDIIHKHCYEDTNHPSFGQDSIMEKVWVDPIYDEITVTYCSVCNYSLCKNGGTHSWGDTWEEEEIIGSLDDYRVEKHYYSNTGIDLTTTYGVHSAADIDNLLNQGIEISGYYVKNLYIHNSDLISIVYTKHKCSSCGITEIINTEETVIYHAGQVH